MHRSMVHVITNQRVPFIIYGLLSKKNQNKYKKGFLKKSLVELLLLEIHQDPCFLILKSLPLTYFLKYFQIPFSICQQIYGKNQELGSQEQNNNDPEFTVLAFILPGKRINNHIERLQRRFQSLCVISPCILEAYSVA